MTADTTPPPPHATTKRRTSAADHKRQQATTRRSQRRLDALHTRITDLERRIGEREEAIRALETAMAAPSFYENSQASQEAAARHQMLMWEVGDLMNQWEALHAEASMDGSAKTPS